MFSKRELKELAGYRSNNTSVLSVYLNTDPTQRTVEQYRLVLKGMLKKVGDKAARQDVEAVERFVDLEYDRQGKGVAIFTCAADDFWRVFPLAVPIGDEVSVAPQAYIKPLAGVLDEYDRYGVVLVDREGARLFLFYLGALQDAVGVLGEELKEHVRGAAGRGGRSGMGAGQGRMPSLERRVDQVAMRNLRDAVALTQDFYKAGRCERIILGGTEENRARFKSLLPKSLQNKVVGEFAVDMYASVLDVLERSLEVIQGSEARRKADLVQSLTTAAHKDSGSLGLADTLIAMQEQRVQTLVVAEGFGEPGRACTHCGYLTLSEVDKCPVCGGEVYEVGDIVDLMVHRAVEMDVEVVFVPEDMLEPEQGVGALWRF